MIGSERHGLSGRGRVGHEPFGDRGDQPRDPRAALGRDHRDGGEPRSPRTNPRQGAGRTCSPPTGACVRSDQLAIHRLEGLGSVEDQEDKVRLLLLASSGRDPHVLDGIIGPAESRRVRKFHGPAVHGGSEGHDVPRHARRRVDDRPAKPANALNNRLFPTLGRPAMTTFHPSISLRPTSARPISASSLARAILSQVAFRAQPVQLSPKNALRLIQQDLGGAQGRRRAGRRGPGRRSDHRTTSTPTRCRSRSAPPPPQGPKRPIGQPRSLRESEFPRSVSQRESARRRLVAPAEPHRPSRNRPGGVSASEFPRDGRKTASTTATARSPHMRTTAIAPRPSEVMMRTKAFIRRSSHFTGMRPAESITPS